MPWT
jgi:seryl-tRNA synthetase